MAIMKHHLRVAELKGSHLRVVLYVGGTVAIGNKKSGLLSGRGGKTGVGPLGLVAEPGNGCAHVAAGLYVSVFK